MRRSHSKQAEAAGTRLYKVKAAVREECPEACSLSWTHKWRHPKKVNLSIHGIGKPQSQLEEDPKTVAARRQHIYEVFSTIFDQNKDLPITPEDQVSQLRNYIDTLLDEAEKLPRVEEKDTSDVRVSDKRRICKQFPKEELQIVLKRKEHELLRKEKKPTVAPKSKCVTRNHYDKISSRVYDTLQQADKPAP